MGPDDPGIIVLYIVRIHFINYNFLLACMALFKTTTNPLEPFLIIHHTLTPFTFIRDLTQKAKQAQTQVQQVGNCVQTLHARLE